MSGHLSVRELEEIAQGAPAPAHTARCARCLRKLSFLRAEGELFRRAAAGDEGSVERLWPGVQARIARRRRARRAWTASLAAAAAAAALIVALPGRISHGPPAAPGARAALDRAETEYLRAIQALESSVELREQALPEAAVEQRRAARARTRAAITHARAPEVAGRMRQLEGYAAYLRSLRRELDEAP
jgi:hypothetical protein